MLFSKMQRTLLEGLGWNIYVRTVASQVGVITRWHDADSHCESQISQSCSSESWVIARGLAPLQRCSAEVGATGAL